MKQDAEKKYYIHDRRNPSTTPFTGTLEDCQKWLKQNPSPYYSPRQRTESAPISKDVEGFTPGEWEYEQTRGNNRYEHHVFSRNGGKYGSYVIATLGMEDTGEVEPDRIKANAKLIASAPTLYRDNARLLKDNEELREALKALAKDYEGDTTESVEKAIELLNKINK